jgi:hypothetical protein
MVIKIRGDQELTEENREKVSGGEQVCKLRCLTYLFGDVCYYKRVRRVKSLRSGNEMEMSPFKCTTDLLHLRF